MAIEDKYLTEYTNFTKNKIKGYKTQKNLKCCSTCEFFALAEAWQEEHPGSYECLNPKHTFITDEEDVLVQFVNEIGVCPQYKKE